MRRVVGEIDESRRRRRRQRVQIMVVGELYRVVLCQWSRFEMRLELGHEYGLVLY